MRKKVQKDELYGRHSEAIKELKNGHYNGVLYSIERTGFDEVCVLSFPPCRRHRENLKDSDIETLK